MERDNDINFKIKADFWNGTADFENYSGFLISRFYVTSWTSKSSNRGGMEQPGCSGGGAWVAEGGAGERGLCQSSIDVFEEEILRGQMENSDVEIITGSVVADWSW